MGFPVAQSIRLAHAVERIAGLEPAPPAWKAGTLPIELYPHNALPELHWGRLQDGAGSYGLGLCDERKETAVSRLVEEQTGLEPTRRIAATTGGLANLCLTVRLTVPFIA